MTTASLNIRVDSSEVSKADRSLDDLAKSGANADKSATKLTSSTERLSSVARVAAGAFAALGASVSVREIIQASDAWQSAANQLRLVTNSASELSAVQSKLMGVSNDTRSSFESTANLYTRLTRATSEMGLSQSELIGLTTTINQSFAVSGATAAEAAAAITQLSQGLAAGALRGDEFNSVAEQAPGIMRAIAESLNMTTGELRAFAAEGGITADIVVTALQGAATSIDQDFGKSVMTFGQSMQVAKNNMLEFVGTSETVSGALSAAGSSVIAITENLDALAEVLGAVVALSIARLAPAIGVQVVGAFTAASAAMTAGTVATTRYNAALMMTERTIVTTTVSQNLMNGAMALVGGSAGLAVLAAYGIYKLADAYAEHEDAIGKTLMSNEDMIEAIGLVIDKNGNLVDSVDAASDAAEKYQRENGITTKGMQASAAAAELMAGKVGGLASTIEEVKSETEAASRAMQANIERVKEAKRAYDLTRGAISNTVEALENEIKALGMTARAATVFEAVTRATAEGALPAEIAAIATLTAQLYDLEEAKRNAGRATEDLADTSEDSNARMTESGQEAARTAAEAWGRTHDYMSGAFVDLMNNGGNAFDNIAKSFEQMVKRMVAEWAASKLMSVFGMTMPGTSATAGGGFKLPSFGGGGGGGGGAPVVTSNPEGFIGPPAPGTSATPGTTATVSATAMTALKTAGAGMAGSYAGNKVGESVLDKEAHSNIGATVGSTIGAYLGGPLGAAIGGFIGGFGDVAFGTDGKLASNGGFLIRGRNGENEFDVPAFDSGFDPVGFARRENQGTAVQVIDTFRQYDSYLTEIAKAAGLKVNYSSNQFGGFDEKGRGNGTYFGMAGEGDKSTSIPIGEQLNKFVGQWVKGLSGQVDQSLINDVLSAGSADEMVKRAAMLAGVPAFASGGYHAGGLMLVGEQGPELVNTGPSRVLSNSDTVSALKGNSDTILKQVLAELSQIRKYMATSVNIIDQWDGEGMPAVRT